MRKILVLCAAMVGLAGCGVSSEPDYYMLAPVDGAAIPDIVVNFQIERPTIPDYLDRPEIVAQDNDHQISFDEMLRWGAPIDTMFEDILASDLRQRLPNSVITKEEDDLIARPTVRLNVEIENFNATDNGSVLKAQILVDSKNKCATKNPLSVAFEASSPTNDVITSQSGLIASMADQIVLTMRDNKEIFCVDDNASHK